MDADKILLSTLVAFARAHHARGISRDHKHVRVRINKEVLLDMCKGHFPGQPIVPGAHLLGLMVDLAEHWVGRPGALTVHRAIFRGMVLPTEAIEIEVRGTARGPRVRVYSPGSKSYVAQAELRSPPCSSIPKH